MIPGNRYFRTWHIVPVILGTGLAALLAAVLVAGVLLVHPGDPRAPKGPTLPVQHTASVLPSPTAPPSSRATHKPKREHKRKRRTPEVTKSPTARSTPRATRSTTRAPIASSGSVKDIARELLAARGWADQWSAFNALEMGEAGWNLRAVNPSSGACGLPQALPCSKLPNGVYSTARQQLTWMLDYIARNYGSPAKAYAAWLSRSPHWY